MPQTQGGVTFLDDGGMAITYTAATEFVRPKLNGDDVGAVPIDITNSPAATDPVAGGLAYSPTGTLYCTTSAVAAPSTVQGGIARTATGQMHVTFALPSPGFTNGGYKTNSTGAVYCGSLPSFELLFADLGSGVVSIVPRVGGVVGTFTRATIAWTKLPSGLWAPVASGAPRYLYGGGFTTAPSSTGLGYFAEGARTQLVTPLASVRDMTNAAWTAVNITPAKTATGIDGVANSATRLTCTTNGGSILQTLVAAASSRTYSVWLRRVTGTGTITLSQGLTTLDVTASLNSLTYTQVSLNANELNVIFGITMGTSGDVIEADFNQFEAGAFASSPIDVGAVTRNADVLTYPTSPWYNQSAGTIMTMGMILGGSAAGINQGFAGIWDGTANERWDVRRNTSADPLTLGVDGGVTQWTLDLGSLADNAAAKIAVAYAANDIAGVINAGTVQTDATATLPTVTELQVGAFQGGNQLFGTISSIGYFNTRLPNIQLQGMTT